MTLKTQILTSQFLFLLLLSATQVNAGHERVDEIIGSSIVHCDGVHAGAWALTLTRPEPSEEQDFDMELKCVSYDCRYQDPVTASLWIRSFSSHPDGAPFEVTANAPGSDLKLVYRPDRSLDSMVLEVPGDFYDCQAW